MAGLTYSFGVQDHAETVGKFFDRRCAADMPDKRIGRFRRWSLRTRARGHLRVRPRGSQEMFPHLHRKRATSIPPSSSLELLASV